MVKKRKKKPSPKTQWLVVFILMLSTWASLVHPQAILWVAWMTGTAGLVLLWGGIRYPHLSLSWLYPSKQAPPPPAGGWMAWQGRWWASVLLLWGVWGAHMKAWVLLGPPGIQKQLTDIPAALSWTLQQPWYELGYPWILYGVVACCFGFLAPEALVALLFRGRLRILAQVFLSIIVSMGTQLILALSVVSVVLLLLASLEGQLPWLPHLALGIWNILFLSVGLFLCRFAPWPQWGYHQMRRGRGFLFWSLLMGCLLTLTWILFAFICDRYLPPVRTLIPVEAVFTWKMDRFARALERFEALQWAWWLLWTPLVASYWAVISQGRSLRALCLQIVLSAFLSVAVLKSWALQWIIGSGATSLLVWGVPLMGGLYVILKNQINSARLIWGFLPPSESRLIKVRGISKLLKPWLILIITLAALQGIGGWYLLQIQLVAPTWVLAFCIFLAQIVFLQICRRLAKSDLARLQGEGLPF